MIKQGKIIQYGGVKMRSSWEVKWAKYFDENEIKWEYEPQKFKSEEVNYIPDFWLPELKMFFEVKGVIDEKDILKKNMITKVCAENGWKYAMAFDDIPNAILIDVDGLELPFEVKPQNKIKPTQYHFKNKMQKPAKGVPDDIILTEQEYSAVLERYLYPIGRTLKLCELVNNEKRKIKGWDKKNEPVYFSSPDYKVGTTIYSTLLEKWIRFLIANRQYFLIGLVEIVDAILDDNLKNNDKDFDLAVKNVVKKNKRYDIYEAIKFIHKWWKQDEELLGTERIMKSYKNRLRNKCYFGDEIMILKSWDNVIACNEWYQDISKRNELYDEGFFDKFRKQETEEEKDARIEEKANDKFSKTYTQKVSCVKNKDSATMVIHKSLLDELNIIKKEKISHDTDYPISEIYSEAIEILNEALTIECHLER